MRGFSRAGSYTRKTACSSNIHPFRNAQAWEKKGQGRYLKESGLVNIYIHIGGRLSRVAMNRILSNISLFSLNYSYILLILFRTGNCSRRSSNPFRSDIDRSWFDMVYALLVPGRVNISIS